MISLHIYDCKKDSKAFSRKILKNNLSQYLNKNSQDIIFRYNKNGKPYVDDLFFSVSHCRDKIVQIFTKEAEIGIDIEFKNPKRSYLKLAKRYFHPIEFDYLKNLSIEDGIHFFYTLWTAKEAVCKAQGGRLWYYLADNYLTENLKMSPVIKGINLQTYETINDFSLSIACESKLENIKIIEHLTHV